MSVTDRKLLVFLSYSKKDVDVVRDLYLRLTNEPWIDVWFDDEKLLPGQNWDMEIEKAVESADAVLICLSSQSVNKEGYLQSEVRFILDIARTKPDETIFVIPLRLDECQIPRRLGMWQYVDYFPANSIDRAYRRLLDSLKLRAAKLGISTVIIAVEKKGHETKQHQRRATVLKSKKQKDEQTKQNTNTRSDNLETNLVPEKKIEIDNILHNADEEKPIVQKTPVVSPLVANRPAKPAYQERKSIGKFTLLSIGIVSALCLLSALLLVFISVNPKFRNVFRLISSLNATETPQIGVAPFIPVVATYSGGGITIDGQSEFPTTSDATNVVSGQGMVTFQTKMSSDAVVKFYRDEFTKAGYKEDASKAITFGKTFTLAFNGHKSGKVIYVAGADAGGGLLSVTVTLG